MMTNAHCPKKFQSSCSNGSFDQVKNLSLWPLHTCCRKFSLINLQGFAVWFWQMLITKMTFKKLDLIFQISNSASTFLRSGKSTRTFQRATQVPFCTARESSLKPDMFSRLSFRTMDRITFYGMFDCHIGKIRTSTSLRWFSDKKTNF